MNEGLSSPDVFPFLNVRSVLFDVVLEVTVIFDPFVIFDPAGACVPLTREPADRWDIILKIVVADIITAAIDAIIIADFRLVIVNRYFCWYIRTMFTRLALMIIVILSSFKNII
jgi:hypothetical protein